MSANTILIYNATIVNGSEQFVGYVCVKGKFIEKVGKGSPEERYFEQAQEQIDAKGMLLLPGAIDDHVHFREPGLTHKATIYSESRAAVMGGVTSFMDMPNVKPATTTIELLEQKREIARRDSVANYSFYIGATDDNFEETQKVDFRHCPGVKLFMGSSTGNMLVSDEEALDRLFTETKALIAVHAEDEAIIRANRTKYASDKEDLPVEMHPVIRSEEACYTCTARAVALAKRHNSRLHVLHISTARELELFSSQPLSTDKRITAEACLSHLWFCDEDYAQFGTRIKCNPAIKTATDREALREALLNGKIDVIGTDHAPHLLSEKDGGCLKAVSGMPSVQFSLVLMLELARQGVLSTAQVVEKMCHAPALLYRVQSRGFIKEGYFADLVLVEQKEWTISDGDVASKCTWTPFAGVTLHHKVHTVFVNGTKAYDSETGLNGECHGEELEFDNDF